MNKFILILFFLGCSVVCGANSRKDTLWTQENDRIIVTYDLRINSGGVEVKFLDVKKKLGYLNGKKYKKLEDVDIIFFDRTGVYDEMSFSNLIPSAFMVPSDLQYSESDLGYFFLKEQPSLYFKLRGGGEKVLTIPLYLAYREGKRERKLIGSCSLDIALKLPVTKRTTANEDVHKTEITSYEAATVIDMSEDVSMQINAVKTLLEAQTKLPFTEGLQYEIMQLRNLEKEVDDSKLISKIKDCLMLCELRRIELEQEALSVAKREKEEAERRSKIEQEEQLARQEAIEAEQQKLAESEKKRNIWLIIAGVLFAAICFVGNQVFQQINSRRNHMNMMELQQNMARRAEYEAKKYAMKKKKDVVNNIRKSSGKKSKQISI